MRAFVCAWLLANCGVLSAAKLSLALDGVEGPMKDAAVAASGIPPYDNRDVSAAQAHNLYEHAPALIAKALEPYGYYNAKADGELKETPLR